MNRDEVLEIVAKAREKGERADLTRADLTRADLSWANLGWADLSLADLSWADLTGADLTRAYLTGANLTGVNLDYSSGIPFWCGSKGAIVDTKIARQYAAHGAALTIQRLDETDEEWQEVIEWQAACRKFGAKSHVAKYLLEE